MRSIRSHCRFGLLLPLVIVWLAAASTSSKIRYREGTIDSSRCPESFLGGREDITVHEARHHCQSLSSCLSFSFASYQKVPSDVVSAQFFSIADWQSSTSGAMPCFVESPEFHTYVNTTREADKVQTELSKLVSLWNQVTKPPTPKGASPSQKLRRSVPTPTSPNLPDTSESAGTDEKTKDQEISMLYSFFSLAMAHRTVVAPTMIPILIDVSKEEAYDIQVRQFAMTVLVVLADSQETQEVMLPVFSTMRAVFEGNPNNHELQTASLDVISNMCIHSSPDAHVHQWEDLGATNFLSSLLDDDGFVGIQAAIALTHLKASKPYQLPLSTVDGLLDLVETTLDGDIDYGIQWELVPGPLSSLFHYLDQQEKESEASAVARNLVEGEILPLLLRVLEESDDDPSEAGMAWDFLLALAQVDQQAKHWLIFSEESLQKAHQRLVVYAKAESVASSLIHLVQEFDGGRLEL